MVTLVAHERLENIPHPNYIAGAVGGRSFQVLEKETLSGLWKGPSRALSGINASAKQISFLSEH